MYMLVELDTIGGTPSEIITGLKIEPPPRPRAPLVHPPRTENKIIIAIYFASQRMSESTRPLPTFCFSSCSRRLIISPIRLRLTISITKMLNMIQSSGLHFCNLRIDGDFLEPLRKVTVIESNIVITAIKCLNHCLKCEFSASSNFSKDSISSQVATDSAALNLYFACIQTASVEMSNVTNFCFPLDDDFFTQSSSNDDLRGGRLTRCSLVLPSSLLCPVVCR